MSLGLYLVPVDIGGEWPYGHTLLECDRAGGIRDRLHVAPKYPVPKNMTCYYSHEHSNDTVTYGAVDLTDAYGDPIVCYRVDSLKAALNRPACRSEKNRAVRAYLSKFPESDLVVAIWT